MLKITMAEQIVLWASTISTVFTVAWLLFYSRYGIDFTDEGFYLVWMSNPFSYSLSATQFGFIYHPLYNLLDGKIVSLRQANILINFFLSLVLGCQFLKTVFCVESLKSSHRIIISGAIATASAASLVYAGMWLPTPSYNSLALQALLVTAVGFLLADKHIRRESIVGWLLIGVGCWLAFMAKPTTAAALGLCAGIYLLSARKFSVRLLMVSIVTSLGFFLVYAFAIDGSIVTFINRLKGGAEIYRILDAGHHEMLRIGDFHLAEKEKVILVICTTIFFFTLCFSQLNIKVLSHSATILSIVFVSCSLAIIFGFTHKTLGVSQFQGLLIWSVPFAAILAGFSIYRFKGLFKISRARWVLALAFLAFPYVYAFGTNGNYWISGSVAGIFWILGSLVFLSPIVLNREVLGLLLPFGLAVQMMTVALVHGGIESPYRQHQPLRENDYRIEIGPPGSAVVTSRGFGQYLFDAIDLASQSGFKKGTPMIDLTGQSPGILYAIGAKNTGQVWTVGGYPGSSALAVWMLKKVSCQELATAWLLVEPEGPRKISPDILTSFGANMSTDFDVVGTFKTAEGAGGYEKARVQQLLKPIRSVEAATTSCFDERIQDQ